MSTTTASRTAREIRIARGSPASTGLEIGWFLDDTRYDAIDPENSVVREFSRFPEMRLLDRYYGLPPLALAVGLFAAGGWPWLVWGFCVPTVTLAHATFAINTVNHSWGSRRFATPDESRNNLWTALLTLGEGWHNNHHRFPGGRANRPLLVGDRSDLVDDLGAGGAGPRLEHPARARPRLRGTANRVCGVSGLRVGIVGSGISGLAAAHYLGGWHRVTLFESESRLGGHAHTHDVAIGGQPRRVDTGFIVYNHRTYPRFVRLLDELGVRGRKSDMSFGVRCRRCGLEYSSRGIAGLFAQPRRAVDPWHLRLLADIPRFNRNARALLARPHGHEDASEPRWVPRPWALLGELRSALPPPPGRRGVWLGTLLQDATVPRPVLPPLLRQPWLAQPHRRAAMVDGRGRLGDLRRRDRASTER